MLVHRREEVTRKMAGKKPLSGVGKSSPKRAAAIQKFVASLPVRKISTNLRPPR
jgi:hypothetical protein